MKVESIHLRKFKRFTDLRLADIPESSDLVVLMGPNGCGKSSVLDGFVRWHRLNTGLDYDDDKEYYNKDEHQTGSVEVRVHGEHNPTRDSLYVRTAYRNDADFSSHRIEPVFPIWAVSKLNGQPKRDSSSIVRFCKASQSPVYPIRDAILAVNHGSCPSLSSSGPRQWGESALKTSRLPGALSPSWQDRGCTLPQLGAGDNRPIRSNTPWNNW